MHSDLCGKMNKKSLSGIEYFLSIIWKAMVKKSTGRKLKAIHTDNGGEFTSKEFEDGRMGWQNV